MIRGAIEVVTPECVQGWIYAQGVALRGKTVLAFVGDQCIGSASVDVFRQDLKDAGLGDGYLGFSVGTSVSEDRLPSVTVRLEGSDAVLLQNNSRVIGAGSDVAKLSKESQAAHIASLKWALKRGRLAQLDFDYLRILVTFGAYERGLVISKEGYSTGSESESPMKVIQGLLESYAGSSVKLGAHKLSSVDDLAAAIIAVRRNQNMQPVVAILSTQDAMLQVSEGSHVAGSLSAAAHPAGPVTYALSATNVLILDARVTAKLVARADSRASIQLVHAIREA